MHDLTAFVVGIEFPVIARSGESLPAESDHRLQVGPRQHVPFGRTVDSDAPGFPFGIRPPTENLSPHFDDIIRQTEAVEIGGDIVRSRSLRNRIQVELHPRIFFPQPAAIDRDFPIPDESQQRIDVRLLHDRIACKPVSRRKRFDRDVVCAVRLAAQPLGFGDAIRNERIHRIGLVAVQAAEPRIGIEQRHRIVDLTQQTVHLTFQIYRPVAFYHDMISSPLCETVDYGYLIVFLHSAACGHSQRNNPEQTNFKFHYQRFNIRTSHKFIYFPQYTNYFLLLCRTNQGRKTGVPQNRRLRSNPNT